MKKLLCSLFISGNLDVSGVISEDGQSLIQKYALSGATGTTYYSGLNDVQSDGWTSGQIAVFNGTAWISSSSITVSADAISGAAAHFDGIQLTAEPTVLDPATYDPGNQPRIWLKNSDLETYGYSEGGPASGWLNAGTVATDYTSGTTAPVYRADAYNGRPAIETDGAGYMDGSSVSFTSSWTLGFVYKTSDSALNPLIVGSDATQYGVAAPGNSATASGVYWNATADRVFATSFDNTPSGIQIGILRNTNAVALTYYHNGVALGSAATAGAIKLGNLFFMNGIVMPSQYAPSGTQLFELVFFSTALTDTEVLNLYHYLANETEICPQAGTRNPLEIIDSCGNLQAWIDGNANVITSGEIYELGVPLSQRYITSGVDTWVDVLGDTMTGPLILDNSDNTSTTILKANVAEPNVFQGTTDLVQFRNDNGADDGTNIKCAINWSGYLSNGDHSWEPFTMVSRAEYDGGGAFGNDYAFNLWSQFNPGYHTVWSYSGLTPYATANHILTLDDVGQLFYGPIGDSVRYAHEQATSIQWEYLHTFVSGAVFNDLISGTASQLGTIMVRGEDTDVRYIRRDEVLQEYALQLDEAASSITYVGEALPGTDTSSGLWRIKRLDESGDPEVIITWADGDASFDNIWDNRVSLSYS